MEGQDGSVATLTDKMEKLVRENHEFKEEIDAQRQEVRILLQCTYIASYSDMYYVVH